LNGTKNNQGIFETKDLYLAAVLKTSGYEVVDIVEKSNIKSRYFVFESDDSLDSTIHRFWSGELKVNAKRLYDSVRSLKDWLRAVSENRR